MKHKTREIPLKLIEVDLNIIPVVNWLNSFETVYTFFSCEGSDSKPPRTSYLPYVLFWCFDSNDLFDIMKKIDSFQVIRERSKGNPAAYIHSADRIITVDVNMRTDTNIPSHLRYSVNFPNKKTLRLFNKYLGGKQ